MNIIFILDALRSFFSLRNAWPSRKRQHLRTDLWPKRGDAHITVTAASSKRWLRSRVKGSLDPINTLNYDCRSREKAGILSRFTAVKATATIACEVAWIANGVHCPSHRIRHSPVTSLTGVWVLVYQPPL